MRHKATSTALLGGLLIAAPAFADHCDLGPEFRPYLAQVVGVGHIELVPDFRPPGARGNPYLLPGDEVVMLRFEPARVYVAFTAPTGSAATTEGWIRADALRLVADDSQHWDGVWRSTREKEIQISPQTAGVYRISGQATWGSSDPDRVKLGAINVGDLDGTIKPDGAQAGFDDSICHVSFRLFGSYLLVDDNEACGGLNVTFSGVYRRRNE